jgi:hypothetical protein
MIIVRVKETVVITLIVNAAVIYIKIHVKHINHINKVVEKKTVMTVVDEVFMIVNVVKLVSSDE